MKKTLATALILIALAATAVAAPEGPAPRPAAPIDSEQPALSSQAAELPTPEAACAMSREPLAGALQVSSAGCQYPCIRVCPSIWGCQNLGCFNGCCEYECW
jgi:hypothetical protein